MKKKMHLFLVLRPQVYLKKLLINMIL